jgi:hypothetical protein
MRAAQLTSLCRLWRSRRAPDGPSTFASAAPAPAPAPAPAAPRAQVLLVGNDRRFRAVAATLLARRGYAVTVGDDDDVVAMAVRSRADVVVIDAGTSLTAAARKAARLDALRPRVTVLTVGDETGEGLTALPVLFKWSCFDEVLAVIDRCTEVAPIGAGDVLS